MWDALSGFSIVVIISSLTGYVVSVMWLGEDYIIILQMTGSSVLC